MTFFETSNASMVSGLVDYMSTLVSGSETAASQRVWLDKPPPLPPKAQAHRVSSVDRALAGHQPAKPVGMSSVCIQSMLLFLCATRIDRHI